jgi:hypothetical protein
MGLADLVNAWDERHPLHTRQNFIKEAIVAIEELYAGLHVDSAVLLEQFQVDAHHLVNFVLSHFTAVDR